MTKFEKNEKIRERSIIIYIVTGNNWNRLTKWPKKILIKQTFLVVELLHEMSWNEWDWSNSIQSLRVRVVDLGMGCKILMIDYLHLFYVDSSCILVVKHGQVTDVAKLLSGMQNVLKGSKVSCFQ